MHITVVRVTHALIELGNRWVIRDVHLEVYDIPMSEGTKQATKGSDLSEEWRVVEMREGGKEW